MPLMGRLTKPTAEAECDAILRTAERIGAVRLEPKVVRYRTPGFEWEASKASGVSAPPAWRVADMLTITLHSRPIDTMPLQPGSNRRDEWRTWILDTQVVKLRKVATRQQGAPLQVIDGAVESVLPSIRRSYCRRLQIGLWTSRQRVAAVADPSRVAGWLDQMAGVSPGENPSDELLALLS